MMDFFFYEFFFYSFSIITVYIEKNIKIATE